MVRFCDVFILLINKKAAASSHLMPGNVTATYAEFKAAFEEKKHILVFISPEIHRNFKLLKVEFNNLYKNYVEKHHRIPDSPFDPFREWIETQMKKEGLAKDLLKVADPFIWAFIYDIYQKGSWLYDFDIAKTEQNAKVISEMLSTSFRSVVGLINERDQIELLKSHASYLLNYAECSLIMLAERNLIVEDSKDGWSNFLEQAILFLKKPAPIIQAPEFNPIQVNTVTGCFAASLYTYNEETGLSLDLIGTAGEINPDEFYLLSESDVFVVDAYNQQDRIVAFREDKQTLYITEPIENSVLCLHFSLADEWTKERVKVYSDEVEYAIITENELFFNFLKLLIGGKI